MEVSNLLLKFSQRLFKNFETQEAFINALIDPKPFHPSILWCKPKPSDVPFTVELPLPWQPSVVDRLAIATKPGQHSLHQLGFYYCLDFSSIFAASTLLSIPQSIQLVVDMCASPGGKSLFAWTVLHPERLMSNEVIGKRMGALVSNLKRCHDQKTENNQPENISHKRIALKLDSQILAQEIPETADVVIVDAPCTGQSLLAKGEKVPGCFHPVTINKNANRQKRILANSAQIVAPQGYLAYMTCAYSMEENEQVIAWFLERFHSFKPILVPHLEPYQSPWADFPCYRMFPQDGLGAGAFTVLLQNLETGQTNSLPTEFLNRPGLIFV